MRRQQSVESETHGPDAQDLIYDAWDEPTTAKRVSLAKRALKLDPNCADAYSILADHSPYASDKELDLRRMAVAAGEASIGPEDFKAFEGEFWGWFESRPYMRAKQMLAEALWLRQERAEAMDHLRDMLRLNPNDNQGVRYLLAQWLAETDGHAELSALRKRYRSDDSAFLTWASTLAEFRRGGDCANSRKALAKAMQSNPHVRDFIIGKRRMPKELPPYYSPGEDTEAISYLEGGLAAWRGEKGAVEWLRAMPN